MLMLMQFDCLCILYNSYIHFNTHRTTHYTFLHYAVSLTTDPAVAYRRGHADARTAEHNVLLRRRHPQKGLQTLPQLPQIPSHAGKNAWLLWALALIFVMHIDKIRCSYAVRVCNFPSSVPIFLSFDRTIPGFLSFSLSQQALIREEEIVAEDMRSKPAPSIQPGDRAFQKHICKYRDSYFLVFYLMVLYTLHAHGWWNNVLYIHGA